MILNLTAHPIVLRDAGGVDHVFPPRKKPDPENPERQISDPARVAVRAGDRIEVHGCPVPIVEPTVYGGLLGLPEKVAIGQIIVVSLVCAQAAAVEAESLRQQIEDGYTEPNSPQTVETLLPLERRLKVLRALVSPGQGKDIIPWTEEDVLEKRCIPGLEGLTRAVTALVRAVR